MRLSQGRGQGCKPLLELLERDLTLFQAAFEESEECGRVCVAATFKGVGRIFQCLGDRVQVFRTVKAGFFKVIEKSLGRDQLEEQR